MSVRAANTTDRMAATIVTATIGTGALSIGLWVRLLSDRNAVSDFMSLCDQVGPSTGFNFRSDASGTGILLRVDTGLTSAYALTVERPYWLVASRSASTSTIRVFDDTSSTTPLSTQSIGDGTNYTILDTVIVGDRGNGDVTTDCEFSNLKVHTGVAWTDAQCRTESQTFGLQTAGGVDRLAWGLENLALTSYGVCERSTGLVLANTGFVASPRRPRQLAKAPLVTLRMS